MAWNVNSDLELVETDALLAELMRRYEHCIFAGLQIKTPRPMNFQIRFHGQHHTVMGLTTHAQLAVMADLNNLLKPNQEGTPNGQ